MNTKKIDELAKIIWDYHHVNHDLKKADCIFVLCSNDVRVAEYAAELLLKDFAPKILFSGGSAHQNDLLATGWDIPEAEKFAEIANRMGVPKEKIIVENKSTNTGENILFSKKLFADQGLNFDTFILVQKPYMERRTLATFQKQWPEKKFIVTSPSISFDNYPNKEISKIDVINIIVGDLQRIKIYAEKGFQVYQEIPGKVWDAYEQLIKMGYNKHLL